MSDDIFTDPKAPKLPKTLEDKLTHKQIIVVLEKAALETVKTKNGFELLNADEHKNILNKNKKDNTTYRPDIVHQALLTLLDSPLNKAGHLQVYIHTSNNILIEVNPTIRIPRTFKRFCGLMVQLLHKLYIKSADGGEKLMKVIKNPVTQYFPPNANKIATSVTGDLVDVNTFIPALGLDKPLVLMFGSHAHGPAEVEWADKRIAVSAYPLSAATAIARTLSAIENVLKII